MIAVANATNAKNEGPKEQSHKKKRKHIYVSLLNINEAIGRNKAIDVAKANELNTAIEKADGLNTAIDEANELGAAIEEANELNAAIKEANELNAAIKKVDRLNAAIEKANGLNVAIEEATDPMDINQSLISDSKHEFEPGRYQADWYLDLGANAHFCSDLSQFTQYRPLPNRSANLAMSVANMLI
jgi:hypothetical protein